MESKKLTIAIADDHQTIRSVMSSILSQSNFIILFDVNNGIELLERIETTGMISDICIVDINMPDMDGMETTKQLKTQYPMVKILAISAEDNSGQIAKIIQIGADGYLTKDCSVQTLTNTITNLIK